MPDRPVPAIQPWSNPYWQAAREETLRIQRCQSCSKHLFYPRLVCPHCFSENLEWVEASGRGKVYTYSVVHNNPPSNFADQVPFVIAVVELDEGVRLMTNIVGCDPDQVRCDMAVEVTFHKLTDEVTLPVFKPLEPGGGPNA